jgi:hypothetical protein
MFRKKLNLPLVKIGLQKFDYICFHQRGSLPFFLKICRMKKLILFIAGIFLTNFLFSVNYYVAINGTDSNDGTSIETPYATITAALSKVNPGEKIIVRGGSYEYSSTISISKSGTKTDTCYLVAYENEKPILDFTGTAFGKRGISLSGSFWKIKGFELKYAGDNAMFISGGYNTIEFCSFHDNEDSGLQMGTGAHDNKIINCDSYFNADPTDYGDADGFACKLDVGSNNYFYGCRSWLNCDDGWDGYMRGNDDVSTVLENCWTWRNGYFKDGKDAGAKANGNGFKVGGSDDKKLKHNFTLINCLAFYNKAKGFDQNSNMGSMFFYNCTGYANVGNDFSVSTTIASGKKAEIKNCVLYNGKKSLASFVVQQSNSWDSKFTVDASDFISIDTTGISGPRQSDGSLPKIDFMHLAHGSDLINAGIDLGFPFLGYAPDLGAFETEEGVGVNQLSKSTAFKTYQIGKGLITVKFEQEREGSAVVNVFNLSGRKILTKQLDSLPQGENEATIAISLPGGIYLVSVNSSGNFYLTKLFID